MEPNAVLKKKDTVGGITIIDDYAHHPTEIRATLEAQRIIRMNVSSVFFNHIPIRVPKPF